MTKPDQDPDFVASARRLAAELLPMLQGLAEAAYNPRWAEEGTTPACYALLLSAALHQLATVEMAREANRRPDAQAMFMGMRTYGMMWHCMVDIALPEELLTEGEIIH
jgi:hypothetical protein